LVTRGVGLERGEGAVDVAELGRGGGGAGQVADVAPGDDLLALQQELINPHAGRVGDAGDDLGRLLRLLLGRIPRAVGRDLQVLRLDALGAAQVGERAARADGLGLAAVAGPDALGG
jgi:hypothetical protein